MTVMRSSKILGLILMGLSLALLIVLGLTKVHSDYEEALLCDAFHNTPGSDLSQCPVHGSHISWLLLIASGITFLILGVGVYLLFLQEHVIRMEERTFKPLDASKLDGEERRIYDLLKAQDGSMYQSDLIKETGLSKVKVTRMLDKLTTKGVIDRKRRGMTNLIILK